MFQLAYNLRVLHSIYILAGVLSVQELLVPHLRSSKTAYQAYSTSQQLSLDESLHHSPWSSLSIRHETRRDDLQILMEPRNKRLIRVFVRLLDLLILEVTSRCHEAMDLLRVPLDHVLNLQALLVIFHRLLILVL